VVTGIQAMGGLFDNKKIAECSQPFDIDGVKIKVNEVRLKNNEDQFISYPELAQYAQLRADEIASTGDVNHESKYGTFGQWAKANNIPFTAPYETVGEVLDGPRSTSCQTVEDWENSPTHFALITDKKFTSFGAGLKDGYSVVILGNPQ